MFHFIQFVKRLLLYLLLFFVLWAYFFRAHADLLPWALLPFLLIPILVEALLAEKGSGHRRIKLRKYNDPLREMKRIDGMDGHDFEYYVAQLLKYKGFQKVRVTQGSGDYGVDILASKGRATYAVQCKRYKANVGVSAIQEVAAGRDYYECDAALVVTTSLFTPRAKVLAETTGVELWDRGIIEDCVMDD